MGQAIDMFGNEIKEEQSAASKIKFQLQFMAFMMQCGRDEEAQNAFEKAMGFCDEMIEAEGLENVFARHTRIAKGVRHAVEAWGLELCANAPELYSDSVSAIRTPEGFNATDIVTRADEQYGMAFGVGLGEVAGKVFRIGHLGMLTDAMMLSGLGVAEMVMKDLGLDIKLGSGVPKVGAPLCIETAEANVPKTTGAPGLTS